MLHGPHLRGHPVTRPGSFQAGGKRARHALGKYLVKNLAKFLAIKVII